MGVGGQRHTLAPLASGETVSVVRKLGGPQKKTESLQKILPPLGFEPRTVKPVASCYIG